LFNEYVLWVEDAIISYGLLAFGPKEYSEISEEPVVSNMTYP
jgi:hypothetical protein